MLGKARIKASYPDSINRASYLVAFNPEKLIHYGSAAKKSMYLSSSDVDLLEPLSPSKSDELAHKLKQIVRNIEATPLCYLGDFKSGIDEAFICPYVGQIKGKKVTNYDKAKMIEFIEGMPKDCRYSEEAAILKLCGKRMNIANHLKLKELMRKDQIIRWTRDEIMKGYKMIRNAKVYLADTIKDESAMSKIDTIQWIETENRFVEVTNYFKVGHNADVVDVKEYGDSLKQDIIKTYYNGNLFKMCKRLISYSLLMNDSKTSNKLYEIMHSGLGIMYQVIADIKTILYLNEHMDKLPEKHITTMIDGFKQRLGSVYEFDFKEQSIDKLIDKCKTDYNQLYKLYERLYTILNSITKERLIHLGYEPLPKKYCP